MTPASIRTGGLTCLYFRAGSEIRLSEHFVWALAVERLRSHAVCPRAVIPLLPLLFSCATTARARGPEDVASAYAEALREGRLGDAWGLTGEQLPREEFEKRYSDEKIRADRARLVAEASGSLEARSGSLVLARGASGWVVVETYPEAEARKVLESFLAAAEAQDFGAAYRLLSGELRSRYTPERLKEDFQREPLARERLSRARAALDSAPEIEGRTVRYPVGDGKSVRLVFEDAGYRVAALE